MGLVERESEMQELNAPRPGRSRDLFGVQLEVREVTYMSYLYEKFIHLNSNVQRITQ